MPHPAGFGRMSPRTPPGTLSGTGDSKRAITVSGRTGPFIVATAIESAALRHALERATAGAVVVFEGVVRDHHAGRGVVRLDYEAHPELAETRWEDLRRHALATFDVHAVCGQHRIGSLGIGECAVWIGVSAPHRLAAFRACEWLIGEVKRELPIWKREHYTQGRPEWRHEPDPGTSLPPV